MHKLSKVNVVAILIIIFCVLMLPYTTYFPQIKTVSSNGITASIVSLEKERFKQVIEISL